MPEDRTDEPSPYSPTESLESIKQLRRRGEQLRNMHALALGGGTCGELARANNILDRITRVCDLFYEVLGERHWVISSNMELDRIEKVVSQSSPEEAERELISYLKEPGVISRLISSLKRFSDMLPRIDLLKKAERDYLEGRYYSSTLVTVSVMDGFVNDVFKDERRGMHAREAGEMHTRDRTATVWEGLPLVQREFTRPAYKRIEEPLLEVRRNALMHGMATNYDNDIIASKAWCMLFAVGDWAEDKKMEVESCESVSTVSMRPSTGSSIEFSERSRKWEPHNVDLSNPATDDMVVIDSCNRFLDAWASRNYGAVGLFFADHNAASPGRRAREARTLFSAHPICDYSIGSIVRTAPSVALLQVRLESDDETWIASVRFVRMENGHSSADWEPGEWRVVNYGTDPFRDIR